MTTAVQDRPAAPADATVERAAAERGLDPSELMIGTSDGAGLWIAPEGTRLPDPGEPMSAPWTVLGFISDDGVTIGGDTTTETITPWQSITAIRTLITEKNRTLGFTLWQINELTLGLYFDTEVPEADENDVLDFTVRSSGGGLIHAMAVATRDGARILRFGWPRASLDSTGDMSLTKGASVPLEVTMAALDAGGDMVQIQRFPADYRATETLTVTATESAAA